MGFDASGFAGMNLQDIFSQVFGGGGGFSDFFGGQERANPLGPQQGRDLEIDISLEFMEAVNGTKRDITLNRYDECKLCESSGMESGTSPMKCKLCNGHGMIGQQHGMMFMQQTCFQCNGTGQYIKPCKKCNGSGLTVNKTTIEVKIPGGVDDGTRVRISNQGHSGKNKGGRGHAWILCRVKEDSKFERHGSDIHCMVNIPVETAILGGSVTVPTLTGEAQVKVKAGTPSDHKEIMRGKGIREPNTGRMSGAKPFTKGKWAKMILAVLYPSVMASSVWVACNGYGYGGRNRKYKEHFKPPKHQKAINIDSDITQIEKSRREFILKEILNLYECKPTYDTSKIYTRDATFDDPTVYLRGKHTLNSVIFGLPVILSVSSVSNLSVSHYCHGMVLNYDYKFKLKGPFPELNIPVTSYLELNENCQQICKHKDLWYGRKLVEFLGIFKGTKYITGIITCKIGLGLASNTLF